MARGGKRPQTKKKQLQFSKVQLLKSSALDGTNLSTKSYFEDATSQLRSDSGLKVSRKFDPHENVASEERNDDADESSADEQDPVEPRCAGVVRPV